MRHSDGVVSFNKSLITCTGIYIIHESIEKVEWTVLNMRGPWFGPHASSVQNYSQLSGNSKLGLKAKRSAQLCEQTIVVDTHDLPSPGSAM